MSNPDQDNTQNPDRYPTEKVPQDLRNDYEEYIYLHDYWVDLRVDHSKEDSNSHIEFDEVNTTGGLTPLGFKRMMELKYKLMAIDLPESHRNDKEARIKIISSYLREDIEDHILSFPDIDARKLKSRVQKYARGYKLSKSDIESANDAIDRFIRNRELTQNFEVPKSPEEKRKLLEESFGIGLPDDIRITIEKGTDRLIARIVGVEGNSAGLRTNNTVIAGSSIITGGIIPPIILVDHNFYYGEFGQAIILRHEWWHIDNQITNRMRDKLIGRGISSGGMTFSRQARLKKEELEINMEKLKDEVLARLVNQRSSHTVLDIESLDVYQHLGFYDLIHGAELKSLLAAAPDLINRLTAILKTNQATPRRFRRAFYILAHTRFADWGTMVDAIEKAYAPK